MKGIKKQLKESQDYKETVLSLGDLEKYLMDRLKDKNPKNDFGLSKYPPRKLTWQEANALCGISEEEYENSTGLYQIGYTITGLGGFNMFTQAIKDNALKHLKDIPFP